MMEEYSISYRIVQIDGNGVKRRRVSMAIKNCRQCGRIFSHPVSVICPVCKREQERDFEKVRDYLRENADAGIHEVSERTGVSVKVITKYLREGRLQAAGITTAIELACENCGAAIQTGQLCDGCKANLQKEFHREKKGSQKAKAADTGKKKKKKEKEKMFLFDRIKKRKK